MPSLVMFYPGFLSLFILVALSGSFPAWCQENLVITDVVQEKNMVKISYDLEAADQDLRFEITPYYVTDAGKRIEMSPTLVSGAVGENVTTGNDKTIIWQAGMELDVYEGKMTLEIDYQPIIDFQLAKEKYKRPGKMLLKVDPSHGENFEVVDLHGNKRAQGTLEKDRAKWNLKLPKSLPLSQQYRIRIKNENGIPAYSTKFFVQRRLPLSIQIVGAGLVAGAILYFVWPDPSSDLPSPPAVPDTGN